MSRARDLADSADKDIVGTLTADGLSVDGGTIKLDGNYPVGTGNVALGDTALDSNVSGASNTAIGSGALTANTASNNTAVGYNALLVNTTGTGNTAFGYQAGDAITTANENTIVGFTAGTAVTTGAQNCLIGAGAGGQITTGGKNTVIGGYTGNNGGLDIRTSSNNIVLSDGDGNPRLIVASTGNIAMGNETNANDNTPTNGFTFTGTDGDGAYLNIGHNNTASGYGYVRFIYNGGMIGAIEQNGTTGVSYLTSSDYRLKENVVELTGAIDRVKQLKPSQFNFITEPDRTVDGFLAHEAQAVVPEAVTGIKDAVDEDGNPEYQAIDQSKLVPLLTGALKEAITKIEELESRISALEA